MSFSPIDFIFIGCIGYEFYFYWVLRNFGFKPANEIFSKKKGEVTRKISKEQIKQDKIKEFKKTEDYLKLHQDFEDVELIDIEEKND